MGLLGLQGSQFFNNNQVLPGARTATTTRDYVQVFPLTNPTGITVTDGDPGAGTSLSLITLQGGSVEINSRTFTLNNTTINLFPLLDKLKASASYIVAAVPAYLEPLTKTAATTAGVKYTVRLTENKETILSYFADPTLEASVNDAGGYVELQRKFNDFKATDGEKRLFLDYQTELDRLTDPRYTGRLLDITGVRYVLYEVSDQDNFPSDDITAGLTQQEFEALDAVVPVFIPRRVSFANLAAAGTVFDNLLFKVESIAINFTNGAIEYVDLETLSGPTPITSYSPVTPGTVASVVVFEKTLPSYMSIGQRGNQPKVKNFLTKEDVELSDGLGRINPIYLEQQTAVKNPRKPLTALTLYGDPLPILRCTLNSSKLPTTGATTIYQY